MADLRDQILISAVIVRVVGVDGVIMCEEGLDNSWFTVEPDLEGTCAVIKNTKPIRLVNQSKEVRTEEEEDTAAGPRVVIQLVKNGIVLASGDIGRDIAPGCDGEFAIGELKINWPCSFNAVLED